MTTDDLFGLLVLTAVLLVVACAAIAELLAARREDRAEIARLRAERQRTADAALAIVAVIDGICSCREHTETGK